jgi:hypothetical protein
MNESCVYKKKKKKISWSGVIFLYKLNIIYKTHNNHFILVNKYIVVQ